MRIALIGRDADRVLAFRGSLIRLAQREGHDVIAITGAASEACVRELAQAGVRWFEAPLDGGGLNPFADLAYRRGVERVLRRERVDSVLAYNPKCLAHAPIAARRAGVPRVVGMVTGLGHGFIGHGLRERLVRRAKLALYRRAFRRCDTILVQNEDDLRVLESTHALGADERARTRLVPGSGVDVAAFAAAPMPEGTAFLMVSRPLREKGLPEFFEAAALVRRRFPGATFTWLGPMRDANPSAIDEVTLRRWLARGDVRHEPERADIRGALAACTAFVLPSHREGTSKVVLEAMATGRCVVTTDAPGCAQVIEHGQSGLTVRAGSAEALAAAMASLCDDPATARRMGTAARARAERLYRSELVDGPILSALLAR